MNVAKNNFDLFHFNINNTSTSSIALIKKKYRLRFLSNVVRFLMLIFNTSIMTLIFLKQNIVNFFLFTQKISKTLNYLSIFDLFKKNILNFIVLFNFNFFCSKLFNETFKTNYFRFLFSTRYQRFQILYSNFSSLN